MNGDLVAVSMVGFIPLFHLKDINQLYLGFLSPDWLWALPW